MYLDVKLVVYAELYGFSGNVREIKEICEKNGALLVEDAAEVMGASWEGKQCGSYGDYAAISYNGSRIQGKLQKHSRRFNVRGRITCIY